ncbi:S-adenosyl-L-methionine-dependent methyltransferase [Tothia fuscella]|uniref:DNA (cytosine-5-)-methyltransferase n=1 Tax=Tothia fuscella TaxID=1048955 RepID=A0A9P4NMI2_9PEZI|nr:S-adenosyl-L-methionine-dependent methyltransferase [Tothia fuscella]
MPPFSHSQYGNRVLCELSNNEIESARLSEPYDQKVFDLTKSDIPRNLIPVENKDDIDSDFDAQASSRALVSQFIDLTESDREDEDYLESDVIEEDGQDEAPEPTGTKSRPIFINVTEDPATPLRRGRLIRNQPITSPLEALEEFKLYGLKLERGTCVEFQAEDTRDFLLINTIYRNTETSQISFRGLHLRRQKYTEGLLPKQLNELVLCLDLDEDDIRPSFTQAQIDVPLENIVTVRTLKLTEEIFPLHSFRVGIHLTKDQPDYSTSRKTISNHGKLVCRYVYTRVFPSSDTRSSGKRAIESELRSVRGGEFDDIVKSQPIKGKHRSSPQLSQSQRMKGKHKSFLQDSHQTSRERTLPRLLRKAPPVTYASGCAGAGGDCTGAALSGARVKYAWDKDEAALTSLGSNHPNTRLYQVEAKDFPGNQDAKIAHTDILHLSWPCQVFSPAHTVEGPQDDENSAAIFGTYEKIRTSEAIVHMQENTAGLFRRHPGYFGVAIQEIVRAGHNVRWKVVQFADFGISSSRERLIIFSARYVERDHPLPKFPKSTHGKPGSGLPLHRSIHDAISGIPPNATWHLTEHEGYKLSAPFTIPREPYDARSMMAQCITRASPDLWHPNGKRRFTPREVAMLNGFPVDYTFYGTSKTKVLGQIGNAVPPLAWQHFVKACVATIADFRAAKIDVTGERIATRLEGNISTSRKPSGGFSLSKSVKRRSIYVLGADTPIQSIEKDELPSKRVKKATRAMVDLTLDDD